jgi:DNA-binding response OmpR family regulator
LKTIAIIDDDVHIGNMIEEVLKTKNYTVLRAYSGTEALYLLENNHPDLVLLDLMLPGLSGEEVLPQIKDIPVIVISAKVDVDSKVNLLMSGAADYLTKPFDTKEIVARIKAVLRRTSAVKGDDTKEVRYDKLTINLSNYEMKVDGVAVDTPPKELELIYHLASNPDRVFTRDQLLDDVWGFDYYGDSRTVDVHVKRLRDKLKGVSPEWELRTIWSVGYKFETHGKK